MRRRSRILNVVLVAMLFGCQGKRALRSGDTGVETVRAGSSSDDIGVSTPIATSGTGGRARALSANDATARPSASQGDISKASAAGKAAVAPNLRGGQPTEVIFTTEGSSFAPVLTLKGNAKVRWTWADGTQSDSTRPTKSFGTKAPRRQLLRVEPWSAVVRINIGYDAGDGGDPSIERVADQAVSAVDGLELVAPFLEQWCSSFNQIASLDFRHFHRLKTIECYHSKSLKQILLEDTPNLQRACLEDVSLTSLDLSESPALTDLRGALNAFPDIRFGRNHVHLWHICIRDNPQLQNRTLFSNGDRFPRVAELFIWKTNQTGTLAIHSTHPDKSVEILAAHNAYETVDFTGALQSARGWAAVDLSHNALARLSIRGASQIKVLNLSHNRLGTPTVDGILAEVDGWHTDAGALDLRNNAAPSADGKRHQRSLEARRWKIEVDSP